jgi:hypothetical protein
MVIITIKPAKSEIKEVERKAAAKMNVGRPSISVSRLFHATVKNFSFVKFPVLSALFLNLQDNTACLGPRLYIPVCLHCLFQGIDPVYYSSQFSRF